MYVDIVSPYLCPVQRLPTGETIAAAHLSITPRLLSRTPSGESAIRSFLLLPRLVLFRWFRKFFDEVFGGCDMLEVRERRV